MSSVVKWLYFGMHVKRWLGLLVVGVLCVSLGTANRITHLLRELARTTLAAYHAGELGSNGRRRSARVPAVTEGVA
jgi:hypothetical protein